VQRQTKIIRWQAGKASVPETDAVAVEEPLEIRVDNQPITVTMRTPGHDNELAAGFLLSEALVTKPEHIAKIEPYPRNKEKNVLNVFLAPEVEVDFKRLTRHVFVSSSCGLCGKASIESVHQHFPRIKAAFSLSSSGGEGQGEEAKTLISATTLYGLPEKLRHHQQTFAQTGGLHAAAIFDTSGNLIISREDIGRHNAVDKVLGYAFLSNLNPLQTHILLVSGRASFEIMQKALAARIPIVAAVSAPSSLAVEFAEESGQTLVGFLRDGRMNIYSHQNRIVGT
jgi:FdhD protein